MERLASRWAEEVSAILQKTPEADRGAPRLRLLPGGAGPRGGGDRGD